MATPATKRQKEENKPKVQSLLFEALEADGSNYLEWSIDFKTYLTAEELEGTINAKGKEVTGAQQSKALLILRRYIDYSLRKQYLMIDTPQALWKELKARFLHEKTIHLPQARNDWIRLRVLDFADLISFTAELHRIVSMLRLCGQTIDDAELIDKTLSTFPPAAALLAQQYRNMQFQTHAKLMSYLMSAEKQQQILLKNAEQRPSAKETHTTELAARKPKGFKGRNSKKSKDSSNGTEKNRKSSREDSSHKKPSGSGGGDGGGSSGETRNCHKCGRKGHLAKDCRTDKYFTDLYKELQLLKAKRPESHMVVAAPTFGNAENYMVSHFPHDLGLSPEIGARDLGLSPEIDAKGLGLSPETLAEGIALASSPESG
jgi:hypothetical protein